MREALEDVAERKDLVTIGAGVAIGLVGYFLVETLVTTLISPLIAVFIGVSPFELNSFAIDGSEFRYGAFLQSVIIFVVAVWLAYAVFKVVWRREPGSVADRPCPECLTRIPASAKRCRYCTAVVSPVSAQHPDPRGEIGGLG